MHVSAFIQARMGSTRLPGKVLKPVLDHPLLYYVIERLKLSNEVDNIIVVTTTQTADDAIASFCQSSHIACFRGAEEDVLSRFYHAAVDYPTDLIVRITADCPLIDPKIIDQMLREYSQCDYCSNTIHRTFPRGFDVEIFSFNALQQAFQHAASASEREHVTPYIYTHPDMFRVKNFSNVDGKDLSHYRLTVDTPEDFALIQLILECFPNNVDFSLQDVIKLLKKHPEWVKLNAHIEQKK